MADIVDIAAVDPALELTLRRRELVCRGTLDIRTRPFVLEAAASLLADHPAFVTIDISELNVADVDGANTFVHLQRMTREAGTALRWRGLDSGHLRGILPLEPLSGRRRRHAAAQAHRPTGTARRQSGLLPVS